MSLRKVEAPAVVTARLSILALVEAILFSVENARTLFEMLAMKALSAPRGGGGDGIGRNGDHPNGLPFVDPLEPSPRLNAMAAPNRSGNGGQAALRDERPHAGTFTARSRLLRDAQHLESVNFREVLGIVSHQGSLVRQRGRRDPGVAW